MSPQHQSRHLLAYSLASAIGIAYYYWKNKVSRKDGDVSVLYSDSDWEGLLLHYNHIAKQDGFISSTEPKYSNSCIYLDYNGKLFNFSFFSNSIICSPSNLPDMATTATLLVGTTPVYPPVLAAMLVREKYLDDVLTGILYRTVANTRLLFLIASALFYAALRQSKQWS